MAQDALIVEHVSKRFGDVNAVDSLTVRVPRGCIYGFLGPNGAGKTTTLRMVMDIIRPDAGAIRVLGRDSVRQAKDRVGYMPEERGLYEEMSVAEVLDLLGRLKGLSIAEVTAARQEWLSIVGLTAWADRKVQDLSRGMRQRLQFVAAILHRPELAILDEPFSGLDPVNLDLIKGCVSRLCEEGTTIVLSTHMMEQAESLCDYILLINNGRKLLDGTLDEIRQGEGAETLMVRVEEDGAALAGLPGVQEVRPAGLEYELLLKESTDPQIVLRELVGRTRVRSFRLKEPSLHEVFVSAVRHRDE